MIFLFAFLEFHGNRLLDGLGLLKSHLRRKGCEGCDSSSDILAAGSAVTAQSDILLLCPVPKKLRSLRGAGGLLGVISIQMRLYFVKLKTPLIL